MTEIALGIIDAQRGFMPAEEGLRLHTKGFGELAVAHGEEIVRPVNRLLWAYALQGARVFTTQDWHPMETAHFAAEPDFHDNWPTHCVADTPGALLHPDIHAPSLTTHFVKGTEPLLHGADDISYSGYNAHDPITNEQLPHWLEKRGIEEVVLGGLALDYCVGKTAIDLRQKLGLRVIVALDATRSISEAGEAEMLADFARAGIETAYSEDLIAEVNAHHGVL